MVKKYEGVKHITRDRPLTPEEADKYAKIREQVEQDLPDLIKQAHAHMATKDKSTIGIKTVHIFGGGTFSHVRSHLSLATPAFGTTAKRIFEIACDKFDKMNTFLHLTKMADPGSLLVTNEDVESHVALLTTEFDTKIIFMNAALCDFNGDIVDPRRTTPVGFDMNMYSFERCNGSKSTDDLLDKPVRSGVKGKYADRLKSSDGKQLMELTPAHKILKSIRANRKDIFLVAFKTTCGASEQEQYLAGLKLLKTNSCNLVLANDVKTRLNMIITPEEAKYHVTDDRDLALTQLVDMTYYRSQLTFTHSTVVDGTPVPWDSALVYPSLREIVNYCIERGAYKPFNGATVGHFACKIKENEFLTSIRKTNFNVLNKTGLVRVVTDGPDSVIAYGAKPSVGGQSQRLVFSEHQDCDCIVHFHCPLKDAFCSKIPVVSQREYECGSHQCGQNTSIGLKKFGNLYAVMLDNHGPNIVFHHSINPQEVIDFIEMSFDLRDKTGGLMQAAERK